MHQPEDKEPLIFVPQFHLSFQVWYRLSWSREECFCRFLCHLKACWLSGEFWLYESESCFHLSKRNRQEGFPVRSTDPEVSNEASVLLSSNELTRPKVYQYLDKKMGIFRVFITSFRYLNVLRTVLSVVFPGTYSIYKWFI